MIGIFIILSTTQKAEAADITLGWNHVDFASVGSDLSQSGYRFYHSVDGGAYAQIGQDVPTDQNTFTHSNVPMGTNCYRLSAFNQYGESGLSTEVCAPTMGIPPVPDGATITINISITVTP